MTPRTDAVIRERWETHSCEEVPAEFARELERELAEAKAENARLLGLLGECAQADEFEYTLGANLHERIRSFLSQTGPNL